MKRIDRDAIKRVTDRRKREDQADRLRRKVPNLEALSILIEEHPRDADGPIIKHTRRIMVDNAPALFEIPCVDHLCKGGGHDLTRSIIPSLRKGKTVFEGHDHCDGEVNGSECPLQMSFTVEATYT